MATTFRSTDIRTIALVGHAAAGKTSLADALLFEAHAVDRKGSVDDGTSVSDFDDEEHRRHFSIDTTVLHAETEGREVHLLDAPGYPDFVGAAFTALDAVDNAVVVVSAVNGVEVNTRRLAQEAGRLGVARAVVINKLDADNADFAGTLAALRATFGRHCVLVNAPLGEKASFRGVVCLLEPVTDQPADCPVDLAEERGRLVDAIVECDDALMERYLNDGDVPADELEAAIPRAMRACTIIPVFCVSAKKQVGVAELLHALAKDTVSPLECHPHPVEKRHRAGQTVPADGEVLELKADGDFVGQVFKTVNDKFVGQLSFLRVLSGRLTADKPLINQRTGKSARVNQLLRVQGRASEPVAEASAGDIVAVAKVDGLHIGDTVTATADGPELPHFDFPRPMFGLAVQPKNRGDEQKISASLHKMADEDPTFKVSHDPQTHELVISGVSPLHLEVIQQRLKRRFDLEVVTHEPRIPYRETISGQAEASHKHKKQSGGRGQFAEVHLRVYALPPEVVDQETLESEFATKTRFEKLRDARFDPAHRFAFLDHIVGGSIPNQFLPAIEKGCKELLESGALAGYRIEGVAVEVFFGKSHDVDSSEAAFKLAGRRAFKKAFLAARPVLMEPVVRMEVTVPGKDTGAILSDLPTKRGHVENQESLPGDLTVITARVPLSEVVRYKAQLDSMTHGQGSYTMAFDTYELVPTNVQQAIIGKAKLADEEDE